MLFNVRSKQSLSGDEVGQAYFELADIIGSLSNAKIMSLEDRQGNKVGNAIVRIDKLEQENKQEISLKMSVDNVPKRGFFSSRNSFLKIFKLRQMEEGDVNFDSLQNSEWILIKKTPAVQGKQISLPEVVLSGSKLCNNKFDLPIKVELWKKKSKGKSYFLGKTFLKLNDLVGHKSHFGFQIIKNKSVDTSLRVTDFKSEKVFDFLDFLRGGLNISLIVGVDFTQSNKDPEDPSSLHHVGGGLNLYQQAILAVGEVLEKYNHEGLIPCYGFGAKLEGDPQTQHFFPMTLNYESPCVQNFKELFEVYRNTLQQITFSGPTYFAQILKQVIDVTSRRYQQDQNNYSVFLLLTDGVVNDLQATIDQIVSGCYHPLSIIIVGIGNEDFKNMEVLDADNIPLVSSWSETMARDIVQFVPFNKFSNNPVVLREEVLDELPRQVKTFYKSKNIKPQQAQVLDVNTYTKKQTFELQQQRPDLFIQRKNSYPSLS